MIYFSNPRCFPIFHFPLGMQRAILAIHAKTKAPLEIVAASTLAAAAIATQHLARSRRPSGQISPISLAILTLGGSGDRKTSADEYAFAAIKAFEKSQAEHHRGAVDQYEIDLLAWRAHRDGIILQIKQFASKNKPTDALIEKLKILNDQKPTTFQKTKILYADTTPEALAISLNSNSPSAALVSNEAARLLFGPAMSNLSLLSELWSGGSVSIDRVTSPSFTLDNHLLTTSLMIQPSEFERYMKAKGAQMRGSGYLARCLPTCSQSLQGFRENLPGEFVPEGDIDCFHQRITDLLQINNARPTGRVISFDLQAASTWTEFFNEIERNQRQYHIYADIGDFASKIADNAARIATIFCLYEGMADFVEWVHIQQAIEICKWYLAEFKMLFGAQIEVPEEQKNATALEQWASNLLREADGFVRIERSLIMQYGPNRIRSREQLNKTLNFMKMYGRATEWKSGRKVMVTLGRW